MLEKPLQIKGRNGLLAAVHHQADPSRLVIFAHGYTGTKCESGRLFVQTARALAEAGISALRFDFWGSGDSEGGFEDVSPNTEIADLHSVIGWARRKRFSSIGVLGLSLGGAVSICTVAENPRVKTLVTWSAVPKLEGWTKGTVSPSGVIEKNPITGGPGLSKDHPKVDVPEAYLSLKIPKLQIQGDNDLPGFREGFECYFPAASAPKKHVVIPGADHVFTSWPIRRKVIRLTVDWFQKYL
jgi:alpha/beta superfamily hydrolase